MKKVLYLLLGLFVFIVIFALVVANSSYVIKKAADTFAPDYNISYDDIRGNILSGVEIECPKFLGRPLAKSIVFRWNPSKLLYGHIAILTLETKRLNVDTVNVLVDTFPAPPNNKSSTSFPFTVTIDKVYLDVDPFVEQNIAVNKVAIDAGDIRYASERMEVGDFIVQLDTNVTTLHLRGSLSEGEMKIGRLDMHRFDTQAFRRLLSLHNSRDGHRREPASKQGRGKKTGGSLLDTVMIERMHADILPTVYTPVHIHGLELNAKSVTLNLPKRIVIRGTVDLNGTTNLSNFTEHMLIRDNHLNGHIVITPNQPFFDLYAPMIRKEAVGDISLDFSATKEKLTIDINAKAKHLLLVKKEDNATKPFNIDIDRLDAHIVYFTQNTDLDADMNLSVSTPLSRGVSMHMDMDMGNNGVYYRGVAHAQHLLLPKGKEIRVFDDLNISFEGDKYKMYAAINTHDLKGYLRIPNFQKQGILHLETKKRIALKEMLVLPEALHTATFGATVDLPVDLDHPLPIHAKAKVRSNLVDIDADLHYGKRAIVTLESTVPQRSLLRRMDEQIQWSTVSPMKMVFGIGKGDVTSTIRSDKVNADIRILPEHRSVEGKITFGGLNMGIKSETNGTVVIAGHTDSIGRVLKDAGSFYRFTSLPKADGKADIVLLAQKGGRVDMTLSSPKVTYYGERKRAHEIDQIKVSVGMKERQITLHAYDLTYNKIRFFSDKPSIIDLQNNRLKISDLWLNNMLKISGDIDMRQRKGKIVAKAESLPLHHDMIDVDSRVDLVATLDGNRTNIQGKVTILEGTIHYDLARKQFPSDSDIVIVQQLKKRRPSTFMDNLSMNIQVETKSPLVYRQEPIDVKAKAQLLINKTVSSEPLVIGSVDIEDGSSYIFQGKKFVLERSHIYFTGDPQKPLLDLTAKYRALRHLIKISITGAPAIPTILFSAVPSLSKEQILSIILFDSDEAAGSNNADEMMKMMGGAMAKAALNDVGVKIDHLVIGEGNSVEVGKKLTDKITVIYINGEVPKMEMKYRYSPTVEVVVGASEQSESVDVNYIKDFHLNKHQDDIVIRGKKK